MKKLNCDIDEVLFENYGDGMIITGYPNEEDTIHNCDSAGCGLSHVVWRYGIPMVETVEVKNLAD